MNAIEDVQAESCYGFLQIWYAIEDVQTESYHGILHLWKDIQGMCQPPLKLWTHQK